MPVYHFHLTFGERLTEDAEVATLADLQAAQKFWGRWPPRSEVLTVFIVDVSPEAIRKRTRWAKLWTPQCAESAAAPAGIALPGAANIEADRLSREVAW